MNQKSPHNPEHNQPAIDVQAGVLYSISPSEFDQWHGIEKTLSQLDGSDEMTRGASYLGDQYFENPEREIYLSTKRGGKLLETDEYLDSLHAQVISIGETISDMPAPARRYYKFSPEFAAAFMAKNSDERREKTKEFVLAHGAYCAEKYEHYKVKVQQLKGEYTSRVSELADAGILPVAAEVNLSVLDNADFAVTDQIWSSHDSDSMLGGNWTPDKKTMLFSVFLDDRQIRSAFFHEATHAISGRNTAQMLSFSPRVVRTGMPGKPANSFWLNEAITEHVSQVLQHGHKDVVKPSQRALKKGEDQFYVYERELLSDVVEDVSLDTILKAYFLNREPDSVEYTQALRNLVRAWPKISKEISNGAKSIRELEENQREEQLILRSKFEQRMKLAKKIGGGLLAVAAGVTAAGAISRRQKH